MGAAEAIPRDLFSRLAVLTPEASLRKLLAELPPRPIAKDTLDGLVKTMLETLPSASSVDNRRTQWEYTMRKIILDKTMEEDVALATPNTTYYTELGDILDVVLTLSEHDACDQSFVLTTLQDLFETHTIASCSHIFAWTESHTARLTHDLVPQKGPALVILRTLNDLLRRLPKMGPYNIFCGRILAFLSGILPLGERSAVNLRGEYGAAWEGVQEPVVPPNPEDTMHVDTPATTEESKKQGFYQTFWSLQHFFSRPTMFVAPNAFEEFKEAVGKVLPIIKEATAKERAMMGSRGSTSSASNLKARRNSEIAEEADYFFAKFLTSPDLIDLEIADTHFRRQFLFQLLILLHHLLTFTKAAKAAWMGTKTPALKMDFTLEPANATWCTETIAKAIEELKSTAPNGRAFAETVQVILEREQNWVKWKVDLCPPFDKPTWVETKEDGTKVGLEEATAASRAKMMEPPEEWQYKMGTDSLTEVFEMGYRGLGDLERPFHPGDIKDFVKKISQEDSRIAMRQKALDRIRDIKAAAAAAEVVVATPPVAVTAPSTPASAIPPGMAEDIVMDGQPISSSASDMVISPKPLSRSQSASNLNHPLPMKPLSGAASSPLKTETAASTAMLEVPTPVATPTPTLKPPTPIAVAAMAPAPTPVGPIDPQIARFEETKQRWSWLALRTMRDTHLRHFSAIGTGDVIKLSEEIKKEAEQPLKVDTDEVVKADEMKPGDGGSIVVSVSGDSISGDDKMEVV